MLTLFLIMCYVGTGVLIARQSIAVDDGCEKSPFWKFLLFPIGASHGNPGEGSACRGMNDDEIRFLYYAGQTVGWPVRLIMNVPSYLAIGAPRAWVGLVGKVGSRRLKDTRKKTLPAAPSAVRTLSELRRHRRDIDEQIARLQTDLKGEIEAEETVDPKFLGPGDPPAS